MSITASASEHVLRFRVDFCGPFHVGAGSANQGLDRILDRENPLPATSLKGLMRAAASERLRINPFLCEKVFGTSSTPAGGCRHGSPWRWSDAELADGNFQRTARIRITDEGITDRGFLMLGETLWAKHADFTVELAQLIPVEQLAVHRIVLRACALAIDGIGGGRRRGEGWVSVTQVDDNGNAIAWTRDDSAEVLKVREAS